MQLCCKELNYTLYNLTPLDPTTPCDPCDRVKFILGAADDVDTTGCHDPTVHTVFTELEELKYDEHDHGK